MHPSFKILLESFLGMCPQDYANSQNAVRCLATADELRRGMHLLTATKCQFGEHFIFRYQKTSDTIKDWNDKIVHSNA